MTLGAAIVLLAISVIGIFLTIKYIKNRAARIICIVLSALLAAACAVYIGLNVIFINAVSTQPPAL